MSDLIRRPQAGWRGARRPMFGERIIVTDALDGRERITQFSGAAGAVVPPSMLSGVRRWGYIPAGGAIDWFKAPEREEWTDATVPREGQRYVAFDADGFVVDSKGVMTMVSGSAEITWNGMFREIAAWLPVPSVEQVKR